MFIKYQPSGMITIRWLSYFSCMETAHLLPMIVTIMIFTLFFLSFILSLLNTFYVHLFPRNPHVHTFTWMILPLLYIYIRVILSLSIVSPFFVDHLCRFASWLFAIICHLHQFEIFLQSVNTKLLQPSNSTAARNRKPCLLIEPPEASF